MKAVVEVREDGTLQVLRANGREVDSQEGQKAFDDIRDAVAATLHRRRLSEREKQRRDAQRLVTAGRSVLEVASTLGVSAGQVRVWVDA